MPAKCATMIGRFRIELAKITGMTEHVFKGIGNVERSSRLGIFLEFVTGISRYVDARTTHMPIAARNTAMISTVFNTATAGIFPDTNISLNKNTSEGNVDRILAHKRIEIPLPASIQSKNVLSPIRTMAPTLQITDAAITAAGV